MANGAATPALWRGWTSEGDRWPLWLPVALGAGAALYFAFTSEPVRSAGWAALALAAGAAAVALAWRAGRIVLALLVALALGFAVAKLRADAVAAPVLAREDILHLNARIAGMEAADTGVRLILDQPISGAFRAPPARLAATQRGDGDGLEPGGWISLTADLSPPRPPAEPGAAVNCQGPRFIADGPRAARDQGYALWFTPALKIESVRAWRGMRPWAQ